MMKSRVGEAKRRHREGYNCSQSVFCTYSDLLGLDEKTAFKISEGFGMGIARRYETCGCVCSMVMLAGLKNSDGNMSAPKTKVSTFDLGNAMSSKFEDWNTSCNCATLRGTNGVTDRVRSCRGCVADCARIIEDMLFEGQCEPYEERQDDEI